MVSADRCAVWMVAAGDQGNYHHGEAAARTAHHGTSAENPTA
jgi:hypothetical protein